MFRKKGTGKSRELLEGIELTTLVHGEKTLMGQFTLARGASIPAHSHPHEQTGFMVSGKLRFVVDGETMDVAAGDSWCLPGGSERHVICRSIPEGCVRPKAATGDCGERVSAAASWRFRRASTTGQTAWRGDCYG